MKSGMPGIVNSRKPRFERGDRYPPARPDAHGFQPGRPNELVDEAAADSKALGGLLWSDKQAGD
jgi:hypothetical protein